MKLSDYVADFLAKKGIRHVFAVSGGASVHLIDSIARHPDVEVVCPQHEQAGAMAADAYARVTANFGAAVATSGPGATNMLTGVCSAYYDSVPAIYLTGQVATFRMKGDTGVRQIGFQETDTLSIYQAVTKYAAQVMQPDRIRYELEKACFLAKAERPGPVLIDIPDDLQRADIDPERLESYSVPQTSTSAEDLARIIDKCAGFLAEACRPVLVLGWGVHLARAEREARQCVQALGVPVTPTWAAADIVPSDDPLLVGTFGTHGTRYANFAVQNADLVLVVGSRLDTKATGSPMTTFARGARKVVVDIDPSELSKFERFGLKIDLPVAGDAREFLRQLAGAVKGSDRSDISEWLERINSWKERYPICPDGYTREKEVNPYVFVKTLAAACEEKETVVVDTGCTVAWMMQAFDFKQGQRLYHDWNNTAMGWGLPAAIGAALALHGARVVCVTGDGSLQMNIQELATVMRHRLPIKIFLLNNHGYNMIQQTQDQWLESRYIASTVDGGLAFPDWVKVATAYGYPTFTLSRNTDMAGIMRQVMNHSGPCFCNVEINAVKRVLPQVKFGRPNEDSEPLLERAEFLANMIVEPLACSKK